MSRALVLLCVFCFLEVFAAFGQKQKKLEKTKKKLHRLCGAKGSHRAIVSRVLVLLCVFCFLEVFLWFLVKKNKKKSRKLC